LRRFFEDLCADAGRAADLASFHRLLLARVGEIVPWHMSLVVPTGPMGDDDDTGAVCLEYDAGLFEVYLQNRHRYYPSLRPLASAMRTWGAIDSFRVMGDRLRTLDIFREIIGPSGIGSQLHAPLTFRGHSLRVLSLKRRLGAPPFGASEVERLRALLQTASTVEAAVVARCTTRAAPALALERLSQREGEVLALLRGGLRNKEIAVVMGTAVDTVRKQTIAVYNKLGLRGRPELLRHASAVHQPLGPAVHARHSASSAALCSALPVWTDGLPGGRR
jgi:DNA-binding CsgD family transcriptional regulator